MEASSDEGTAVVLGNFDGVHRGHREVARSAAELARVRGLRPRIVTFHPHPSEVLGRGAPEVLTSRARKRELVDRLTPPIELFEQAFDLAFAAQSPRDFARHLKVSHCAALVVVGKNFRFGKGRAGDFDTLAELGRELGFEARAEPLVVDDDGPISSTRIRQAIHAGDVAAAASLLGRPHMVEGRVEHGRKLGRTLGFPTCNLGDVVELVPALGIYATAVDLVDAHGRVRALARGATSVGTNPTVGGDGRRTIETYLFDGCSGDLGTPSANLAPRGPGAEISAVSLRPQPPRFERDLYDERIRVHFIARLRGEARFDGLPALVEQMNRDVAASRAILSERFATAPASGGWA